MEAVEKLRADAVVVGSGPGGATVARDLTLRGKNVIILEWGSDNKPTGTVFAAGRFMGGAFALGKGMLIAPGMLTMIRCITLGGTTMMYLGTAYDPPAETFKKYGVDLTAELVDGIKKELHVHPFPDEYIGPRARMIMQAGRDLGYEWNKLNKFTNSPGKPASRDFFYGCTNEAKWQARDWVLDAAAQGALLMTNTYCEEVIVEGKTATGVRAAGRGGRQFEISADHVIVAAGGIGSPTLLQRSGLHDAGRQFFIDPFVLAFGYLDRSLEAEIPMVTGTRLEEGIMITDMTTPLMMHLFYALSAGKTLKTFQSGRVVSLMTKIRDDLDGNVSIGGGFAGGVTKPLTFDDLYKLNKGKAISRQILRKIGARDIWYSRNAAAHPGGTCRIGRIVDANLQTEYKNLYVADCSVIPEPWGLPPVLTIISLARRLSRHLTS